MTYFITEDERRKSGSTCYIEFQKGAYDGKCWKNDSLCISDELFHELKLSRLFSRTLPQFDYFGVTQVTREAFDKLRKAANSYSFDTQECLNELADYFYTSEIVEPLFTVCGM